VCRHGNQRQCNTQHQIIGLRYTFVIILQDAGDSEHGLPPLPPNRRIGGYGGYGGGGGYMGMPSASDQFREASDKLRRLQATAAGPPTLKDTITVGCLAKAMPRGSHLVCCGQCGWVVTESPRVCCRRCTQLRAACHARPLF
jgi:hypothetical protein